MLCSNTSSLIRRNFFLQKHLKKNVFTTILPLPLKACSYFMIVWTTKSRKQLLHPTCKKKNKQTMFSSPVENVLYCCRANQELFGEIKMAILNVAFHKGLLDNFETFSRGCNHCAIVLDNLMDSVLRDVEIRIVFSRGELFKN